MVDTASFGLTMLKRALQPDEVPRRHACCVFDQASRRRRRSSTGRRFGRPRRPRTRCHGWSSGAAWCLVLREPHRAHRLRRPRPGRRAPESISDPRSHQTPRLRHVPACLLQRLRRCPWPPAQGARSIVLATLRCCSAASPPLSIFEPVNDEPVILLNPSRQQCVAVLVLGGNGRASKVRVGATTGGNPQAST